MRHYYAIAERGGGRTWWISFPDLPGVFSAADDAGYIVKQAQDAIASALTHGGNLPASASIEGGAKPPNDLAAFAAPALVVVIPLRRLPGRRRELLSEP